MLAHKKRGLNSFHSPMLAALCPNRDTMNIKDDWIKVKSVLEQGQASTVYCSIATVNRDGTSHYKPITYCHQL